ncbi:hypothetical protein FSP39_006123 [Pinctada imbricata]|uniref:Uncharacterized protein n=1 Tax=Pinctada imbricata TaxID=66713 RepID=A0AA88YGS8_PINIB|nr:hypothetical protein FSP39_006123 [Pinctada imbricata]
MKIVYLLLSYVVISSYALQVTIHPKYLAQGGRVHYEDDRWDGHNGLDVSYLIDKCKAIGTESGRWLNRDIDIFRKANQDPHRHGYADPNHFTNDHGLCNKFVDNINRYNHFSGSTTDMIMEIKGLYWPSWMDTSHHGGKFPNNVDAAADMVSQFLSAINKCSHGKMPAFFEVMNEPDAAWKYISWETVIEFHKLVAAKLKSKFPHLQVGGPTETSIIADTNENNFQFWRFVEQFLNMSLDHMDFFSFHPYNDFFVENGKYRWNGANEARLVAFMDMVENYANIRKGTTVPLIISEFGVGGEHGIDNNRPSNFIDWAHVNQHNAHMFTYQHHRQFIDRAVGFFLANEEYQGENSLHFSLFNHDGSERHGAKAYKFWHHLNYNYKYLRIDSEFDNHDRMISPLALADPTHGKIAVLLHNYDFSGKTVNLHFLNNMISTSGATSTCIYLDNNRNPIMSENSPLHWNNGNVYMHPDSSCIFSFHSNINLNNLGTIQETDYYGHEMKIQIKRQCSLCILSCQGCENAAQTHVNVGSTSNMQYVKLRIAVTLDKHNGQFGNPTPKGVKVNDHNVSKYYRLFLAGRWHEDSLWEVYVYDVPTWVVKHGSNSIKVAFNQEQGYVTSMVMSVGTS